MSTRKAFILFLFLSLLALLFSVANDSVKSFSNPSPPQKSPVHLLIVSSWRSGSSFLGQIFNQHKDVFYMFEPGHVIWMTLKEEPAELLHYPVRDLLRSLFTCDVSPLKPYLPSLEQHVRNINFFAESRALCSPPVCLTAIGNYDRKKCYYSCGNATLDMMEESCRSHSHVVLKTVRIFDLTTLLPLIRESTMNLKILHLVRDPRAVAASRKNANFLSIDDQIVVRAGMKGKKLLKEQVMMKICNAQVAINKVAKSSWISQKGRYMLLRYEDLAIDPLGKTEKLFRFAGLSMNPDLKRWIFNMTHKDIKQFNDFLSFSKESVKLIDKWRTELSFKMAKEIEQYCQEAMDVFGYLSMKSEKDMKSLTRSLVVTTLGEDGIEDV